MYLLKIRTRDYHSDSLSVIPSRCHAGMTERARMADTHWHKEKVHTGCSWRAEQCYNSASHSNLILYPVGHGIVIVRCNLNAKFACSDTCLPSWLSRDWKKQLLKPFSFQKMVMQTYPSVNISGDLLKVIGFILSYANEKCILNILWKIYITHLLVININKNCETDVPSERVEWFAKILLTLDVFL